MEYKEILGLISVVLALGISLSYLYTIVKGKTRPHFYTIAIDAIISTIVIAGAFYAGAGAGVWNLAASTSIVYVIVVLCWFKYATKDVTRLDGMFAAASLLTVIPWILTNDPTLSVVLASLISVLSLLPAIRKTWNNPYSEPWSIWGINASKHVIAIAATSAFSVATLAYPVTIITTNALFALMILYRRRSIKPRNR